MKLIFAEQAWEDYLHWQVIDKKMLKRINLLIRTYALPIEMDGLRSSCRK